MTQSQLLLKYIEEHGLAIPAKLCGSRYREGFFGADITRRARDLRKAGVLKSERDGKFEKFTYADYSLTDNFVQVTNEFEVPSAIKQTQLTLL